MKPTQGQESCQTWKDWVLETLLEFPDQVAPEAKLPIEFSIN